MKICLFLATSSMLVLMGGCNMFTTWQAIPPPGGCDQCHTTPINKNWFLAYQAPVLTDENGPLYFQTQKYSTPNTTKPASSLELKKVEDVKCFACHKTPDLAHKGRTGRFHH